MLPKKIEEAIEEYLTTRTLEALYESEKFYLMLDEKVQEELNNLSFYFIVDTKHDTDHNLKACGDLELHLWPHLGGGETSRNISFNAGITGSIQDGCDEEMDLIADKLELATKRLREAAGAVRIVRESRLKTDKRI